MSSRRQSPPKFPPNAFRTYKVLRYDIADISAPEHKPYHLIHEFYKEKVAATRWEGECRAYVCAAATRVAAIEAPRGSAAEARGAALEAEHGLQAKHVWHYHARRRRLW